MIIMLLFISLVSTMIVLGLSLDVLKTKRELFAWDWAFMLTCCASWTAFFAILNGWK
jgi:hypothetical protein